MMPKCKHPNTSNHMMQEIDQLKTRFRTLNIQTDSYKGNAFLFIKGYKIKQGCLQGKIKDIAILLNNDFPTTPPIGLHISDADNQIPLNTTSDVEKKVLASEKHSYRPGWKYISRKVFGEEWNQLSNEKKSMNYINFIEIVLARLKF